MQIRRAESAPEKCRAGQGRAPHARSARRDGCVRTVARRHGCSRQHGDTPSYTATQPCRCAATELLSSGRKQQYRSRAGCFRPMRQSSLPETLAYPHCLNADCLSAAARAAAASAALIRRATESRAEPRAYAGPPRYSLAVPPVRHRLGALFRVKLRQPAGIPHSTGRLHGPGHPFSAAAAAEARRRAARQSAPGAPSRRPTAAAASMLEAQCMMRTLHAHAAGAIACALHACTRVRLRGLRAMRAIAGMARCTRSVMPRLPRGAAPARPGSICHPSRIDSRCA